MPANSDDSPIEDKGRNDPEAAGELFDESLLVGGDADVADILSTLRQGFVAQFRFGGPCGPNSIAWMYANAAATIRRLAAERDQLMDENLDLGLQIGELQSAIARNERDEHNTPPDLPEDKQASAPRM